MSITTIPVFPERLVYKSPMFIDGSTFVFAFKYQRRTDRWYMDILTEDLESLVSGIRIVTSWPLLRSYSDSRLPSGEILCVRSDSSDADPDRFELGTIAQLLYFTADEIPTVTEQFSLKLTIP